MRAYCDNFIIVSTIISSFFFEKVGSYVATTPQFVTSRKTMTSSNTKDHPSNNHDVLLLDLVLQVAIEASKKAGDIIVGNAGGAEVTERKANSRDLLTLIDPMCEKVRVVPCAPVAK